jgi:hypothetical protein
MDRSGEQNTAAALAAVTTASQRVGHARRKPDLVDARRRRDRAIVKAMTITDCAHVAKAAGISVTRVKQIIEQHR